MDKLINRRYIDPSLPGIAYQLAHGRGLGDPRMFEGWIAKPKGRAKPSRYDWGFNHG